MLFLTKISSGASVAQSINSLRNEFGGTPRLATFFLQAINSRAIWELLPRQVLVTLRSIWHKPLFHFGQRFLLYRKDRVLVPVSPQTANSTHGVYPLPRADFRFLYKALLRLRCRRLPWKCFSKRWPSTDHRAIIRTP